MASKSVKHKWRFGGYFKKIYLYGAQEWNVNWINKTSGEKLISGILKAMNNGLRQQSFARRAVIKVSSISNILPSVLCTALKPNGKFSGN